MSSGISAEAPEAVRRGARCRAGGGRAGADAWGAHFDCRMWRFLALGRQNRGFRSWRRSLCPDEALRISSEVLSEILHPGGSILCVGLIVSECCSACRGGRRGVSRGGSRSRRVRRSGGSRAGWALVAGWRLARDGCAGGVVAVLAASALGLAGWAAEALTGLAPGGLRQVSQRRTAGCSCSIMDSRCVRCGWRRRRGWWRRGVGEHATGRTGHRFRPRHRAFDHPLLVLDR